MKKKRGFGSMDRAKQRQIASLGGKTAQKLGHAHVWSAAEARAAATKSAAVRQQKKKLASGDKL